MMKCAPKPYITRDAQARSLVLSHIHGWNWMRLRRIKIRRKGKNVKKSEILFCRECTSLMRSQYPAMAQSGVIDQFLIQNFSQFICMSRANHPGYQYINRLSMGDEKR